MNLSLPVSLGLLTGSQVELVGFNILGLPNLISSEGNDAGPDAAVADGQQREADQREWSERRDNDNDNGKC